MKAPYRTKFDPAQDFAVRKRVTLDGTTFLPGEDFPKEIVSVRRLRLMFDQRTLVYRKGATPGAHLSEAEAEKTPRADHKRRAAASAARIKAAAAKRDAEHAAKKGTKPAPKADPKPKTPRAAPKPKPAPAPAAGGSDPSRETFTDPAAILKARAAVVIPADWETLKWNERLSLAASLTDKKVKNGDDVAEAINAELKRRGNP